MIAKILLLSFCAGFLFACASVFNNPHEAKVISELGWNKIQVLYNVEIKKCTPVKTEQCIITKADANTAISVIENYQLARSSCLVAGECNPCKLVSLISTLGSIAGNTESLNVDGICSSGIDLDDVFNELEDQPEI